MTSKIFVNFSKKLIVHSGAKVGSEEYNHLLKSGYELVGTAKPPDISQVVLGNFKIPHNLLRPFFNRFFWDPKYFEPKDKYIRK